MLPLFSKVAHKNFRPKENHPSANKELHHTEKDNRLRVAILIWFFHPSVCILCVWLVTAIKPYTHIQKKRLVNFVQTTTWESSKRCFASLNLQPVSHLLPTYINICTIHSSHGSSALPLRLDVYHQLQEPTLQHIYISIYVSMWSDITSMAE